MVRKMYWKALYVSPGMLDRTDELLVELVNQLTREFPNEVTDLDLEWEPAEDDVYDDEQT